jgi:hypothetical protein
MMIVEMHLMNGMNFVGEDPAREISLLVTVASALSSPGCVMVKGTVRITLMRKTVIQQLHQQPLLIHALRSLDVLMNRIVSRKAGSVMVNLIALIHLMKRIALFVPGDSCVMLTSSA